jgi:hypothetical protein
MKTREIEVWINKDSFMNETDARTAVCNYQFINSIKAKLIIEIPEREITIKESEFESVLNRYICENPSIKTLNGIMEAFKEKLFAE